MFGIGQTDHGAPQKLLVALLVEHYSGFRVRASGLKADANKTADDIILTYGVEKSGSRSILQAIRMLKLHNGWKESEETLRRRYHNLQKTNSTERRRMAEMAARLLPLIVESKKGERQ